MLSRDFHFTSVVGRRTRGRHSRGMDRLYGGSGRDDLQSRRGGNARAGLRATVASQSSVPQYVYRLDHPGYRALPRSRCLSSGHCGSHSGHRSAIQAYPFLYFRHDGSRSGSRCRGGNLAGDATYLSERQNSSGRALLRNNG